MISRPCTPNSPRKERKTGPPALTSKAYNLETIDWKESTINYNKPSRTKPSKSTSSSKNLKTGPMNAQP